MTLGSDALVSFELGGELYKKKESRRQLDFDEKEVENVKSVRLDAMYVACTIHACYLP